MAQSQSTIRIVPRTEQPTSSSHMGLHQQQRLLAAVQTAYQCLHQVLQEVTPETRVCEDSTQSPGPNIALIAMQSCESVQELMRVLRNLSVMDDQPGIVDDNLEHIIQSER